MENLQQTATGTGTPPVEPQVRPQDQVVTPPVFTQGMRIGLGIAAVVIIGTLGYLLGRTSVSQNGQPIPTATPTFTATPTATITETPSITPTVTDTTAPTPTVTYTRRTFNLTYGQNYYAKQDFIIDVPSDVTATAIAFDGHVNTGILLKKGSKNFMLIIPPGIEKYAYAEQQGYSSIDPVVADNISSLKRVHAKQVYASSGPYKFAIAYVTTSAMRTGSSCTTDTGASNKTTSPCAAPYADYSIGVATNYSFSAFCSIDISYLTICDRVMKTFQLKGAVEQ